MAVVTIHDAKTNLLKVLARVEAGEEIVIARGKIPVATLVGIKNRRERMFGAFKGKFEVPPDAFFFDPLPEDELRLWQGGDDEDPAR